MAIIGAGVIGIISSFINFVTFALKHPEIAELMKDELFQEALRSYIARTLVAKEVDG